MTGQTVVAAAEAITAEARAEIAWNEATAALINGHEARIVKALSAAWSALLEAANAYDLAGAPEKAADMRSEAAEVQELLAA